MERFVIKGNIVTQNEIIKSARLLIDSGKIIGITKGPAFFKNAERIFIKDSLILPGFIDLHIHGNPIKISNREVRFGTTSFLWTIHPGPLKEIKKAIFEFRNLESSRLKAIPLGIHLEGPYINKDMAGGLDKRFLREPNKKEVLDLIEIARGSIRLITLSPELKSINRIIEILSNKNIVVSVGHSDATFLQAKKAIDSGARHATHLFNRMGPIESREPWILGAVLSDKRVSADFILDGIHVHPSLFKVALACKGIEKTILITDSLCSLEKDSEKEFFNADTRRLHADLRGFSVRDIRVNPRAICENPRLIKIDGIYKDRYGKIKGSRLTMNRAVENAIRFGGVNIIDAVKMASLNPARLLGIEDRKGSLEIGKDADSIILDKNFNVELTMVEGKVEYVRNSRLYR